MIETLRLGPPTTAGRGAEPARVGAAADRWRTALDGVGVALIALYLATFALRYAPMQNDFRTYLAAANAAAAGVDPYRPEHLAAITRRETLPFVYPPVTLPLFAPLAAMPHRLANAVWMAANVGLLAALVVAWRRWLPGVRLLPLALIAAFGWNASALWALRTGNVVLVESALIWVALECYARGLRTGFAALIVAAACFKLTPAAFLLLLLVPAQRGTGVARRLAAALAALAALVLLPTRLGPASEWSFFLRHLPPAEAAGPSNPGALGFATALARMWGTGGAEAVIATAIWAALGVAILAAGVPLVRGAIRDRDPRRLAMTALFLYVLIAPRPMAYGFVLLTPAILYLAPRPFAGPAGHLALALMLAAQGLSNAAKRSSLDVVYVYSPFLLTLCIWLLAASARQDASRGSGGGPGR